MTVSANRDMIERIVQEFETTEYGIGASGTQLWLREYIKYAEITGIYLNDDRETWINGVFEWSQLFAFYKLWSQDFLWTNANNASTRSMASFRFR